METHEQLTMPKSSDSIRLRAKYFDSHPDVLVPAAYLENMHDRMPGSAERVALQEMLSDPSLREALTEPSEYLDENYSDLRRSKSTLAFWDDVDSAIRDVYNSIDFIQPYYTQLQEAKSLSQERVEALNALCEVLVPVYARLRDMGYRYYDIVN